MKKGLLAEFADADALVVAVQKLSTAGYTDMDTFTPYGIKEVERALHLRRSRIPHSAFVMGVLSCAAAYTVMWWCNAWNYPLNVGGFPAHSMPAYVPICFETTILFATLTAFLGVFSACQLPRVWDPLFEVAGFERASIDRFFLAVAATDPRFDIGDTEHALQSLSPLRVVTFGFGP
jgi:hypothetical protein